MTDTQNTAAPADPAPPRPRTANPYPTPGPVPPPPVAPPPPQAAPPPPRPRYQLPDEDHPAGSLTAEFLEDEPAPRSDCALGAKAGGALLCVLGAAFLYIGVDLATGGAISRMFAGGGQVEE